MTMRSLDTRFWSDGWVRKLNPLDRYLFLYLLTNDKSNWCGVYELDLGMMAFECGLDERDLERALLPRLVPKIIYVDGWVYIPNFPKYHLNGSETTKKGYEKAFSQVPEKIRLKIREIEKTGVGMQALPSSAFAFASSSALSSIGEAELRIETITEEEKKPKTPPKYPHSKEVFGLWGAYPRNWVANKTQLTAAENLFEERGIEDIKEALDFYRTHQKDKYCPEIDSPFDLDTKWVKLEAFLERI